MRPVLRYRDGFRWEGVAVRDYKPDGMRFRSVSRQVLFAGDAGGTSELRYFEVEAGGYTELERHDHVHEVIVLRGSGRVLVDREIFDLRPFDLVRVAPATWHQFRAAVDSPLGFLCLVNRDRDLPVRPTARDLERLRASPEIAAFIRV